ncbi:hypothetical protein DM790_00580 [Flavobacterium collinsii]|nr:hypothetical protein [Flavobacterium collinsii]
MVFWNLEKYGGFIFLKDFGFFRLISVCLTFVNLNKKKSGKKIKFTKQLVAKNRFFNSTSKNRQK